MKTVNYALINDMRNYKQNFGGLMAKKVIESVEKQMELVRK